MDLDGSGAVDDPLSDELPPAVPNSGVLFGIDYGERRIGIAVSNDEQTIAMPLENYTRINPERDAAWLRQLTSGYGVRGLVVGLPVAYERRRRTESPTGPPVRCLGAPGNSAAGDLVGRTLLVCCR